MKHNALLYLLFLMLTNCVTTKTINKIVIDKYRYTNLQNLKNDNFTITNTFDGKELVTTKKLISTFIPAIFYWSSSQMFNTEINQGVIINSINDYANEYANSIYFKNKLANKKVYLSIKSVPKDFVFAESNSTIFVLVYAIDSNKKNIKPDNLDLEVDYKIVASDGKDLKTGRIVLRTNDLLPLKNQSIDFINKKSQFVLGEKKSAKTFIKNYLELYDENINLYSKMLIDKLASKL